MGHGEARADPSRLQAGGQVQNNVCTDEPQFIRTFTPMSNWLADFIYMFLSFGTQRQGENTPTPHRKRQSQTQDLLSVTVLTTALHIN